MPQWIATRAGLASPSAVAFDEDGSLWVVCAGDHRVRHWDVQGAEVAAFGGFGSTAGRFRDPAGFALGTQHLYVADTGNHRIQTLSKRGSWLESFGSPGNELGQLRTPRGLDFQAGKLAVADTGNHRIQVFNGQGAVRFAFGERGSGPGQLEAPHDVAWLPDGRLVVADTGNHRIQIFSGHGRFEREFGTWGWVAGTFSWPIGLAVEGDSLYVCERDNHRVGVFDFEGRRVGGWGLHAILPREGEGKLHYPLAIDVHAGRAALAEGSVDRVQIFGPGTENELRRAQAGVEQPGTTKHFGPGLHADATLLAVVLPETAQVAVFDLRLGEPVEITRFGNYGSAIGSFRGPADLLVDAGTDRLWVTDRVNRTLSIFRIGHDLEGPLRQLAKPPRFVKSLAFEDFHASELGSLGGRIPEPGRMAVRRDVRGWNSVFIVDEANARVLELTPGFELRAIYGAPNELIKPLDVAWHPVTGQLLVLDAGAREVRVYAGSSAQAPDEPAGLKPRPALFAFGAQGSGPARFEDAGGLTIDQAGRVWVVDREAAALQKLSAVGDDAESLGTPGLGRLQFYKPSGITTGSGGVIVVDEGNHRLQFLDATGGFQRVFGARLYTRSAERGR